MKFVVTTLWLISLAAFGFEPPADGKVIMTGEYVWNRQAGKPGDIRAEFVPIKEGEWQVSFFFKMRGDKHVYTGTAFGSLTDGELRGKVQNERKNRTWRFSGQVSSGHFQGTHAEINRKGRESATGTIRLTTTP